jgi:hypothetical protein
MSGGSAFLTDFENLNSPTNVDNCNKAAGHGVGPSNISKDMPSLDNANNMDSVPGPQRARGRQVDACGLHNIESCLWPPVSRHRQSIEGTRNCF